MASVDEAAIAETVGTAAKPRFSNAVFGAIAVGLALLSALVTFIVLADFTPIAPTHYVVVTLLLANAATGLLLLAIIVREAWKVVQARRVGRAGSRLHVRIVGLFSVIAAVPAILVAIVASVTLDRGLDRLFSTRTRAAIENSLIVAQAYLREHAKTIGNDIVTLSADIARSKPLFDSDKVKFNQFLNAQASLRGLPALVMLKSDRTILARADFHLSHEFVAPASQALAAITENAPLITLVPTNDYVAAVIKLKNYDDAYLFVARPIDPQVVAQLRETQASIAEFESLAARRFGVQIAFGLMYTVIALILLLSAVWIGLDFANRMVAPIRRLIAAAGLVSSGNLYVQVPVRRGEGDLGSLGETFNEMTRELRTQRDDLVRARDVMDARRRFTEAVLAGASAGVIGLDPENRITILNRSAEKLIGHAQTDLIGQAIEKVVPELVPLLTQARTGGQRLVQGQVSITRRDRERNLSVRVTREQSGDPEHGYVITLDDITDLVNAQRTSAWADIARRIAHEIKNPLTPIQLSAERIKRKYGKVINEDRAVFDQCTDTIVRQVDDIRRMVDEFSRFARMPKPVIAAEDLADTVRQVVFLMRVGHSDIDIDLTFAEDPMPAQFDRRLISQALTNIIKNATEAIGSVPADELGKGRIVVKVHRDGGDIVIDVIDNGIGLPKENRGRLLEPYVTTREKGTGLGLAIVGRIVEEHGGKIELRDAAEAAEGSKRGAWVRLRFAAEAVGTGSGTADVGETAAQG